MRIANYFLHCLSNAMYTEKSVTLATSITKWQTDSLSTQACVLTVWDSESGISSLFNCWDALEADADFIGMSFYENLAVIFVHHPTTAKRNTYKYELGKWIYRSYSAESWCNTTGISTFYTFLFPVCFTFGVRKLGDRALWPLHLLRQSLISEPQL